MTAVGVSAVVLVFVVALARKKRKLTENKSIEEGNPKVQ
jgi:hypothetical protein